MIISYRLNLSRSVVGLQNCPKLSLPRRLTALMALDGNNEDGMYIVSTLCSLLSYLFMAVADSLSEAMQADMQRFAQKKQQSEPSRSTTISTTDETPSSSLKDNLDKFLIGDFFFVCFSLAWLGVGVLLQGSGWSTLLDAWFPLWPLVWQPAIGILMAGALINGAWAWVADKMKQN